MSADTEREELAAEILKARVGFLWRNANDETIAAARSDADAILASPFMVARDARIRAEQREQDAMIAERIKGSHYPYTMGWDSAERVATAIRAAGEVQG